MAITRPRLSELSGLSEPEKQAKWNEFFGAIRGTSAADSMDRLRAQVSSFEAKHKMSSEDMAAAVCSGQLREEGEIASWSLAYRMYLALEAAIREQKARSE